MSQWRILSQSLFGLLLFLLLASHAANINREKRLGVMRAVNVHFTGALRHCFALRQRRAAAWHLATAPGNAGINPVSSPLAGRIT